MSLTEELENTRQIMACLDNIDKLGLKINAGGSAGVLRSLFVYTYD